MSEEIVLKQEAGVKAYDSKSPPTIGLRAGAFAEVGTLILTNYRLAYIPKGGAARSAAWVLGGALTSLAVEKSVSKAEMDDLVKCKGSYSIPLRNIINVETARHMGSGYLRVDNNCPEQKPAHSYILGSGWSKNEDWLNAINSAITATRSTQGASTTNFYPNQTQPQPFIAAPPPPPLQTPICPTCGNPLSYIQQYQRWYCYRERKYV